MKPILKKMLRALLIFVISAIIIYLVPTLINFNNWCKENQLNLFMSDYYDIRNIDSNKIQNIGDSVSTYLEVLENSLDKTNYEQDSNYHSLAEYFNPLGFSVWSYMQEGLNRIFTQYIVISILSGIAIVIAYIIITSKKMNNILKFFIGYFGIMLIIPPIYMYCFTYRFWDIFQTYSTTPKWFYIGYTAIFILMYVVNYKIGVKMSRELNQAINKK
ncbi:MAG: hypothetical protein HFJ38_07565 [Bacilli bacterium]|nr:hypothetical protein [Bacilli bacterium]